MARRSYAVLIDLSGTIHIGDELLPNSKQALLRLKDSQLPHRYVTNTTKESKQSLITRLQKLGIEVNPIELYTSLTAARNYVVSKKLRPYLLLSDDAKRDFADVPQNNANAVVVGLAPDKFHYQSMNDAFQCLLSGAELIAVHKGRYYKRGDGLALGPGPFVCGLEYSASCKSTVIGKPCKEFFLGALHDMNCDGNTTVFMIGDDVHDDIDGAQKLGFKGVLVKTGKYRTGDEGFIQPSPHKVVDSFADAIDYILTFISR